MQPKNLRNPNPLEYLKQIRELITFVKERSKKWGTKIQVIYINNFIENLENCKLNLICYKNYNTTNEWILAKIKLQMAYNYLENFSMSYEDFYQNHHSISKNSSNYIISTTYEDLLNNINFLLHKVDNLIVR